MFGWIAENAGTIVVSLALAGTVAFIVRQMRRDKKRGKSPCGCSCACCPMACACHKQQQKEMPS